MKDLRTTLPKMYARWMNLAWPTLTGRPQAPASELTPKGTQSAAVQEWEDEGGSIKAAKKPGPKLPL